MPQEKGPITHLIRGGQTLLHYMRMFNQIFVHLLSITVGAFIIFLGIWFLLEITEVEQTTLRQWLVAHVWVFFNTDATQQWVTKSGHEYIVPSAQILANPGIKHTVMNVSARLWSAVQWSFLLSVGLALVVVLVVTRYGRQQLAAQKIRGDTLVEPKVLRQTLKRKGQASQVMLGPLPLVAESETRHMLIHGTTGTGKSVAMKSLLEQIKARKEPAIIYDKHCDYIQHFFNPDKDILLNPMDQRTATWNLWSECQSRPDFDNLAAAMIPAAGVNADPFWNSAARTLLAATAYRLKEQGDTNINALLSRLLNADLATLSHFLKGTEAENLASEKAEKTAISIKSVLATYLKSLQYLPAVENSFSVRDWVRLATGDSCLFITSVSHQHEALKPLISVWLDIAMNALMSLEPNTSRRMWILLDELPSLHTLPCLSNAMAESRKFGGCFVTGVQSHSQLSELYGHHGAEEIVALCNTRVFFRSPSAQTAEWVSKQLGQAELSEVQEGLSYGANSMRDGVTLGRQKRTEPLIHPSEIMQLPDLNAYVRLPGQWPITKIVFKPSERENIASRLIPASPNHEKAADSALPTEPLVVDDTKRAVSSHSAHMGYNLTAIN